MALSKEVFQAFEAIVGPQYISDDPAILESYTHVATRGSAHLGPFYNMKTPTSQAVVLPATTEEVQNIIRLCNKYKIKFKASTTFWSAAGYPCDPNSIQIDPRRMNHLEIDEKNCTAIIGPYVTGSVLQSEAMKVGLNCPITGAGGSCSLVAGTASWGAVGPSAIFAGAHAESLLAWEWVMPNGEIHRSGSLGAGSGWFGGEGPGPSTRGMMRGWLGGNGNWGVCTKMAIRLYPWVGPTSLKTVGTAPAYHADLPENAKLYTLCFPTWTAWADAVYGIYAAEIAYVGHRQFSMFGSDAKIGMLKILTDPTKQLCDLPELMKDPENQEHLKNMEREFQLIMVGMTPRDLEYKEKALEKILADTGGWKHRLFEEDPVLRNWALSYLLRLGHKNLNYVLAGAYEGTGALNGTVYFGAANVEEASQLKQKWEDEDRGVFAQTGGNSAMLSLSTSGGGGTVGWEFFVCFDGADKESVEGTREFFNDNAAITTAKVWGHDFIKHCADCRGEDGLGFPQEVHNEMFKNMPQPWVNGYQWKVREAFNPNHLGDSYYRTLDPSLIVPDDDI